MQLRSDIFIDCLVKEDKGNGRMNTLHIVVIVVIAIQGNHESLASSIRRALTVIDCLVQEDKGNRRMNR